MLSSPALRAIARWDRAVEYSRDADVSRKAAAYWIARSKQFADDDTMFRS
jgi:hypothetical protein